MTWSEEVQANRTAQALAKAREAARLRRKGFRPEAGKDADLKSFFGLAAAVAGYVLWRREGPRLASLDWRQLPGIKQLHALLAYGDNKPSVRRPAGQRKQVARLKAGQAAMQRASSSVASTAAAASASAPDNGANDDDSEDEEEDDPLGGPSSSASAAGGGGSGGGGKKKKRKGKKRRR